MQIAAVLGMTHRGLTNPGLLSQSGQSSCGSRMKRPVDCTTEVELVPFVPKLHIDKTVRTDGTEGKH